MSKLNSQLFLRNIIILLIFAFSMSLSAQTQKSKREELKVVSAISSIPLSLVGQCIADYNFTLKNKNNVVIPFSKKNNLQLFIGETPRRNTFQDTRRNTAQYIVIGMEVVNLFNNVIKRNNRKKFKKSNSKTGGGGDIPFFFRGPWN